MCSLTSPVVSRVHLANFLSEGSHVSPEDGCLELLLRHIYGLALTNNLYVHHWNLLLNLNVSRKKKKNCFLTESPHSDVTEQFWQPLVPQIPPMGVLHVFLETYINLCDCLSCYQWTSGALGTGIHSIQWNSSPLECFLSVQLPFVPWPSFSFLNAVVYM